MGGAQPLAASMAGACFLSIDVDPSRIKRRLETRYLDRMASTLDEALQMLEKLLQKPEKRYRSGW